MSGGRAVINSANYEDGDGLTPLLPGHGWSPSMVRQ